MAAMHWPLSGALLLAVFVGATLLADLLPPRARFLPVLALALALGALFHELTRFDHGHADTRFWVGWVAAPIVVIFGGAAWGARRFYGWPDLGVHPPRAAVVACAILLGVLTGVRAHEADLERSERRLLELLEGPGGAQAARGSPSRMGRLAPPAYERAADAAGTEWIGFPVGGARWRVYDPSARRWSWKREDELVRAGGERG